MKELISLSNLNAHSKELAVAINIAYEANPEQFKQVAEPLVLRDEFLDSEEYNESTLSNWLIDEADNQDWACILCIMGYAVLDAVSIKNDGKHKSVKI